jgi:hypothetical protein
MIINNAHSIEWPEINFEDVNHLEVDSRAAKVMYKGLVPVLFVPEVIIKAFYEVLKFKA